jgi:hypothetical protein
MHQPVDHCGNLGVIDVKDGPAYEDSIRGHHDRASFTEGCHNLKRQTRTAFIDRKISQLIEEVKLRTNISVRFAT